MQSRCIQCRENPAKWQERLALSRIYCSRLCQFIGLKDDDPDSVGLEANDGTTRIKITTDQAKEMKTIEYLLEDSGADEYIPLPQISGPTLLLIEQFIQSGQVDTEFMSHDDFFDLLKAANYLDFERLLFYLLPEWINRRPFPGPSELRSIVPLAYYFLKRRFRHKLSDDISHFINRYGWDQWAIALASQRGLLKVVNHLLKDPDVDPSANYYRPLYLAIVGQHLDVVNRLLQDKRVIATSGLFIVAVSLGNVDIVNRLLQDPHVDPGTENNRAIRRAALRGYADVVERLIKDRRVDPSDDEDAAIRFASERGHVQVVNILLRDKRVDPSARDNYAVRMAVKNRHFETIDRLLKDERVDPNAAMESAENNHDEKMMNYLLQNPRLYDKRRRLEARIQTQ